MTLPSGVPMSKKLLAAPLIALLLAGAANAGTLRTLRVREQPQTNDQLAAEVVGVQTRRSPAAIIAQDALYGGLAGLAIGAGVALLNGGDNWGRDLAIGTGAGLLIGGVFGAIDAAANADRAPVGFGHPYRLISGDF
jgi:hypothetical protein